MVKELHSLPLEVQILEVQEPDMSITAVSSELVESRPVFNRLQVITSQAAGHIHALVCSSPITDDNEVTANTPTVEVTKKTFKQLLIAVFSSLCDRQSVICLTNGRAYHQNHHSILCSYFLNAVKQQDACRWTLVSVLPQVMCPCRLASSVWYWKERMRREQVCYLALLALVKNFKWTDFSFEGHNFLV